MKFNIALLGDLKETYLPHVRAMESLTELRDYFSFDFEWIPTETLENEVNFLEKFSGIWAGSGPYKSKTGILNGIRFARENNIPFIGTCSGFGYAVLEFARSQFGLEEVFHPYEGVEIPADRLFLDKLAACGLDSHEIRFKTIENTLTHAIYGISETISEQSHCSYGIHPAQIEAFAEKGMVVSAKDEAGEAKVLEFTKNDLFLAMLYYPQLNSSAEKPHPILQIFLQKAKEKNESLHIFSVQV